MRPHGILLVVATAAGAVKSASAAPGRTSAQEEECFASAVEGQQLRNDGKLVAAKAKLLACSQPSCPAEVARDCAKWHDEVVAELPTFVFGAQAPSGTDLTDARVLVDGAQVGFTSGGRPIPLDPGPHTVRFEHRSFETVTQEIVARGGEKNRRVVVRFRAQGAAITAPAGDAAPRETRPVPLATWVLGATSIAALGVFAGFGATAVGDYYDWSCDVGCSRSEKQSVDTRFLVADVALGVSVVAAAAAIVTWMTRPARPAGDRKEAEGYLP